MKIKFYKIGFLVAVTVLSIFFLRGLEVSAQYSTSGTLESSDAIAVRVVPNPNHYSILRWYESQGFQGSPQSLTVDGYEAIRDGRTVYVNAANLNITTKDIYTNIYLISYNQDSLAPTVDILGQLVSRWKFNSNLSEVGTQTCSFSSLSCLADSDCPDNAVCSTSGSTSGSCLLKTPKNCLVDTDCPASFFCSSMKAKITRDIKRIGQMEELKQALSNFQRVNNRYPQLSAGTYLPGHSVSVWPSWSQELLSNLAVAPSFKDPVNRLGPCISDGGSTVSSGYDPSTCWNPELKKFINEPSGSSLVLPSGSYAFVYSSDASGIDYNLCATMESRASGYKFSPNDPDDSPCLVSTGIGAGGVTTNSPPRLVDSQLAGEPNEEFNGYIQVMDPDGDDLSWTFASASGHNAVGWNGWVSGTQSNVAPKLLDTSNPYQKKVYADKAGPRIGTYNLTLQVSDGRGGVLSTSTPITIVADPIMLEAPNVEFIVNPNEYFSYKILFSGNGFANPTINTAVINQINGPFNILTNLAKTYSLVNGKHQVEYRGLIPTSYNFLKDTTFSYRVSVTDSFGSTAAKNFTILIKNPEPYLNINCLGEARLGKEYNCLLGPETQGGNNLDYSGSSGYPSGFNINVASPNVNLKGTSNTLSSGQVVTIKAANEYGASTTKAFNLKINNYCGDGVRQFPNTEARGGLYNDGYEDCDGTDRVVNNPSSSSESYQYGCSTTAANPSSYPILSNNQCVFLPPSAGGGYCGDGYCQVRINNAPMETISNCSLDCDGSNANCVPSCSGRSCGNDGCGGSCGNCSGDMVCSPSGNCLNAACGSDSDCNDSNPCSLDICFGAGSSSATCDNSSPSGYVDDGNESCTGFTWYDECERDENNNITETETCSTGTCQVKPKRTCSGTVFSTCNDFPDPRIAYCVTKCEGEADNHNDVCLDGNAGSCINTGNGDACAYMGESKTCSLYLDWPDGSFTGTAYCNSDCTGYDTSSCAPNVCNTINPQSPENCYWYKAPSEAIASVNKTCMVKMPVNPNGSIDCVDDSSSGSWQWFRGKIKKTSNTNSISYCSIQGQCADAVNPNKCRYYAGGWTNQCYVPIN